MNTYKEYSLHTTSQFSNFLNTSLNKATAKITEQTELLLFILNNRKEKKRCN